ncbi:MAG: NTP transferase domain-containing protein [Chlorobiaceae bacterium]|nr:NTP transferase domain-containing protein [Chlorobiaceae bacterium]
MKEAIVLAGGMGRRLRQVVPDLPKPMAPVAGRPFLEILLDSLIRKGITRIILSLGFMADKIMDRFGDSYRDIELRYVVENTPLGTGGAVRLAMTQSVQDHVFVFNGDTYLDLEDEELERHWALHRNPVIVGREVPDTARYGRLITSGGRVIGFTEKGVSGSGLINAGCYILNRGQLDTFPLDVPFSLETDFFPSAVQEQRVDLFVTRGHFIDIGIPEDFARAQTELAGC